MDMAQAVDTITQLASDTMRQYQARELWFACSSGAAVVVGLAVAVVGSLLMRRWWNDVTSDGEWVAPVIVLVVAGLVTTAVGVLCGITHLANYYYPLPSMLGM